MAVSIDWGDMLLGPSTRNPVYFEPTYQVPLVVGNFYLEDYQLCRNLVSSI